jgi:hypothetical protein
MAKMMTPGVPEDPAVLAGIAKVAIHHGHLDHALRMMVKSLAGVPQQVAMDATEGETTGRLIEQVRALARRRLGECSEMVRVRAFLHRAKSLYKRRNDLLHGLWAKEDIDGPAILRATGSDFGPIPPTADLESLASDMLNLSNEMHFERQHGFLFEALGKKLVDPATKD